jgi:hypothetical protein
MTCLRRDLFARGWTNVALYQVISSRETRFKELETEELNTQEGSWNRIYAETRMRCVRAEKRCLRTSFSIDLFVYNGKETYTGGYEFRECW